MSEPIDRHTLGVLVAGLEAALGYEWRALGADQDVRVARQTAATLVAWGRELCATAACANCGSTERVVCPDCSWPLGAVVPAGELCSVCRRHHGPERTHAAE